MPLPLRELRERYLARGAAVTPRLLRLLRADPREGARQLLDQLLRKRDVAREERARLRRMTRLERALWGHGTVHVAGTDEVGRGPIAGPVYAAAVILPPDVKIYGIRDSKELSRKRCEELAGEIRRLCVAWHVAQIATEEVDDVNIRQASLACMRLAISGLAVPPTHVLVDGRDAIPELVVPQEAIIRGDKRSVSIAAASILAKVARDAHMRELDSQYPGYGFARNSGYPVDAHKAALRRLGPCPAHRTSYDPVKAALAHS